ncbi:hypothetical protein KC337_g30 [Hortaea werneckii]|nr:hypothetical protein KC337_g30 [Hortaea werneckii]
MRRRSCKRPKLALCLHPVYFHWRAICKSVLIPSKVQIRLAFCHLRSAIHKAILSGVCGVSEPPSTCGSASDDWNEANKSRAQLYIQTADTHCLCERDSWVDMLSSSVFDPVQAPHIPSFSPSFGLPPLGL